MKNAIQKALTLLSTLLKLHVDTETRNQLEETRKALIKLRSDWDEAARSYTSGSSSGSYSSSSSSSSDSSDGCYIATMVYGDYDHPRVKVLREFRDNYLKRYALGRSFIRFYYRHSPGWVERLKYSERINSVIKNALDTFIKIISHDKV
ncbi:MAG: hypothetical protein LUE98_19380 [Tannerellaceae bacterium]|nr:hypothetical protein [Tannerellaceae bacterium]